LIDFVIIQFILSERGLNLTGILSQVFLHIMTAFSLAKSSVFDVISLKCFKSVGISQASFQFFQSPFFSSTARIKFIFIILFFKKIKQQRLILWLHDFCNPLIQSQTILVFLNLQDSLFLLKYLIQGEKKALY
jgi:hypothetical protein